MIRTYRGRNDTYGNDIGRGEIITLTVSEYDGHIGFAPEFCYYDTEVDRILEVKAFYNPFDDPSFENMFDLSPLYFDSDDTYIRARSVRFFNPSINESRSKLQVGEEWSGEIASFNIGNKKTADDRNMVFITLINLKRQETSLKYVEGNKLIEIITSGTVELDRKIISVLTENFFQFRCDKQMIQFKARADEKGMPVQLTSSVEVQTYKEFMDGQDRSMGKLWRSLGDKGKLSIWNTFSLISPHLFTVYSSAQSGSLLM